jgi:hypothetical protein
MPQIDWTPEFKRNTTVEFDRLKLKVGERARIVCLEKPSFAWVHTLRAPKIVDGKASKIVKKRKDGTEFADWDMDFIGRPQCLGDYATIEEDGLDPVNCLVCQRAKESEECAPPERRFAMNVIKYNTKADGTVVTPFGCSSQVWSFTEGYFNKLLAIAQENQGLVGRDLILGPCQVPEAFQKFDIMSGGRNVWETDDRIRAIVQETHDNNRVEDLEGACGRKTETRWLKSDIQKIAEKWQIAHGVKSGGALGEKAEVASLKGELDNLLNPQVQTVTDPVTQVQLSSPGEKLYERYDHAPATTDGEQREPTGGSEPDDFSKLLEGMNLG